MKSKRKPSVAYAVVLDSGERLGCFDTAAEAWQWARMIVRPESHDMCGPRRVVKLVEVRR